MSQHYSDPSRAEVDTALPDVEVFYADAGEIEIDPSQGEEGFNDAGWYFWFCFPGCLPDSDPMGPYETEQEAIAAAQDMGE